MCIINLFITLKCIQDIDHNTDHHTFKKKWGHDPRFEALDRKERETLLNERYCLDSVWLRVKNLICASSLVD